MFFRKVTSRSSGKEYNYLKLIENFREGDKVKQRVVANLGSMDKLTPEKVSGLIAGLTRICGVPHLTGNLETKKILDYGEVLAVQKIWDLVGVDEAIGDALAEEEQEINVPLTVKLMAINQIIKPQHNQAISDWYHSLYLPELEEQQPESYHFQRTLDVVARAKEKLEKNIFTRLNNTFQINTDLAFCLLTSGTMEPDHKEELNLTSYGKYIMGEAEQLQNVDFGLLVSRDGIPIGHKILNQTVEEWEFKGVLDYLKELFDIDRCIFVGERSGSSNPNLEVLVARGYDYIIGRNLISAQDYDLLADVLYDDGKGFTELDENLWYKEIREGDVRYLLCYNPVASAQMKELLRDRLDAVEHELKNIQRATSGKSGSKDKAAVKNAPVFKDNYCRKFFQWQYNNATGEFIYHRNDELLQKEGDLAGAFLLETSDDYLRAQELLKAYTTLAQLRDSFSEIKNFEPGHSFLYTEQKMSANILVGMLAAMLEKIMERMMRQAGLHLDVQHALVLLSEIKVVLNQLDGQEIKSVTTISKEQDDILNAIGLFKEQRIVV